MSEASAAPAAAPRAEAGGKWWVLVAVGVATFMSALDGSVVNAVLPVIRRELGASVAAIEWVVTVYLLVVSGLLLGFGRVGDLRGHKDVYVAGLAGFTVSSALCGLAPTAGWLVAGRALQAVFAAGVYANAPAILTKSFPANERGRALGLQATMTYLGLTTGPSLGGVLAQHLGWRAIFYINVPVGVLGVALCWRFIRRDRPEHARPPFDWLGAGVFFAGLLALLLALNQGHAWGWASGRTLGLVGAALAVLALFVAIERRRAHPMLDLSLFGRLEFSAATAAAILNYVAIYGIIFLIPFFLIQGRGLTAERAGVVLTAQPLVMMVMAPISGALSDRIGTRWPAAAGLAVMAAGLWLVSRVTLATPLPSLALDLALCGLGTGIFIAPNNSGLMGAAPRERQGIAAGVLATARNVGMVLGVGLAGAILTTALHRANGGGRPVEAAVHYGFMVMAALAALGAVVSAARSGRKPA